MKISKMSPRSFSSGMRLTRRSKSSNELRSSKRALVDLERARLLFQKFVQGIADQDAVRKAEEIETARAAVGLERALPWCGIRVSPGSAASV